jgi:NDP-sugar pyrophosphorylase family protein
VVGHLGEKVRDWLADGARWGVRIRYVFDGERLLGTGGALRRALPLLGDPFFVLYGDSYLECDYGSVEQAFVSSGKSGLMTVYRNDDRWDRSNVQFADGRIVRYDKVNRTSDMRHIDYGLGSLRHSVFGGRKDGEVFDLAVIYQDLVARDDLAGFEVADRFFEIGSPSGLAETIAHLAGKGMVRGTS